MDIYKFDDSLEVVSAGERDPDADDSQWNECIKTSRSYAEDGRL